MWEVAIEVCRIIGAEPEESNKAYLECGGLAAAFEGLAIPEERQLQAPRF
jgi:hypothetical protein